MRALSVLFLALVLTSSAQAAQDCEFLKAYDLSEEDVSIMLSVRPVRAATSENLLAQVTAPAESIYQGDPASSQPVGMVALPHPAAGSDSSMLAMLGLPMWVADLFGRQMLEFVQLGFVTR